MILEEAIGVGLWLRKVDEEARKKRSDVHIQNKGRRKRRLGFLLELKPKII